MAEDIGLIHVKSVAEVSDEEFKARRYHNLGSDAEERMYRERLARAHHIKTVLHNGEELKVIH